MCNDCRDKREVISNCGCSHVHSFDCVVYQGSPLDNVGIVPSMRGGEVLRSINQSLSKLSQKDEGKKKLTEDDLITKGTGYKLFEKNPDGSIKARGIKTTQGVNISYDETGDNLVFSINDCYIKSLVNDRIKEMFVATLDGFVKTK